MKKKNIFKFELPDTRFSSILDDHLKGIKTLIGDFKIIDIKQRRNGNIKIWVVPIGNKQSITKGKGKSNERLL